MSYRVSIIRGFILLSIILCFITCGGTTPAQAGDVSRTTRGTNNGSALDINILGEGTEITAAGQHLMDFSPGVIELTNGEQHNDSILVMAVHGYDSRGYEWITGLKNLATHYGSIFFYRYDWEKCPDEIASHLSNEIKKLDKQGRYKKIVIFGHSYGGMVVTFVASQLGKLNAEIHVIAAPLSGFPKLLDNCNDLDYDSGDKLMYPKWGPSVRVIQHKTVHAQDGAFRELASDPQNIDLPFHKTFVLPPTMDGHRLGHNWSVTWVLDKHVGKPHRL